ncbi:MAG: PQQ-binding-like beta-propeller repeat protein [Mycobacteriaceae bacterium]
MYRTKQLLNTALRRTSAGVLVAALLSACGNTAWVDSRNSNGWPTQGADTRNSSSTNIPGATDLKLSWSRPVGGLVGTSASISQDAYIVVSSSAEHGYTLQAFQADRNGRRAWGMRTAPGGSFAAPLTDQYGNVYIGEPGAMLSMPNNSFLRWRTPVLGAPLTAQLIGNNKLLVTTHVGQVNILSANTGERLSALDLVEGIDPVQPSIGVNSCLTQSPQCPVPAAPAYSSVTSQIVIPLWNPEKANFGLVSLHYNGSQLERQWNSTEIPAGVSGSPVLSADGDSIYINDHAGNLWALDAHTGSARWSYALGYQAAGSPSVSDDGLILPSGGIGSHLFALTDNSDHAELSWSRSDLLNLSVPTQAGGHIGYTVIRDGQNGSDQLALLVFDTTTGSTYHQYTLPEAKGFATGVSIGPEQQVVTMTNIGEIFTYIPNK